MSSALVGLSDSALLDAWTEMEVERRRLASREHALIAEIEARGLALTYGARNTAALGSQLLRITPGEARARVKAAGDVAPRRGLTGEELEPIYPQVAAAQADGVISTQHARVIVDTVEKLPHEVRKVHEEQVEIDLVELARQFDPRQLAQLAKRIVDTLDPDGLLKDVEYWRRHRYLDLRRRADGSARIEGELDAECAEYLQTAFNSLAAPRPAEDGPPDPRTAGQRRHDALTELVQASMRAWQLPTSSGVTTTVLVTASEEALRTGKGLATTGTGAVVPTAEASRWFGADTRFFALLLDKGKRPVGYTATCRLFTESQRLALIARDGGCSFPGCTAPPAFCEAHHIVDHAEGGPTSVENGTLLCRVHHRWFQQLGWTCQIRNGRPHWTPPEWLTAARRWSGRVGRADDAATRAQISPGGGQQEAQDDEEHQPTEAADR